MSRRVRVGLKILLEPYTFMFPIPATAARPAGQRVLTVSQLSLVIKETLEELLPAVWVSGEVTNLRRPRSGHIYFDLKDASAVINAVVWKSTAARTRFEIEDGQEVLCFGGVDVYPPHGKYQLNVRRIEPIGQGALQLAFRQLHARLAAEGLFDPARKRPLPRFPQRIALVTSPSGAAVHDFLRVSRERWPLADVLVIPASVQGDGAAVQIASGIARANALAEPPDVIVIGRGGGSQEDLWCFNEELLVRAIVASRVPIVSAVGHEIDITLSDLAADVRAPTPSAAAEIVVPDAREIRTQLMHVESRLRKSLRARAASARERLDAIARHRGFRRPFDWLRALSQRIDDYEQRTRGAISRKLSSQREKLASLAAQLESLSPLAVLARGYSLTKRVRDGQTLRDASDVAIGEQIETQLAHGTVISRVERIERDNSAENGDSK